MRQALNAAVKVQEAGAALQAHVGDVKSRLRMRPEKIDNASKRKGTVTDISSAKDLHKTIENMAKSLQAGTAVVDRDWIVNIVEKHQQCMMCCSQGGLEDNAFGTTEMVMYVLQHPGVEAILSGAQADGAKESDGVKDTIHPIIRRLSNAQAISDSPTKRRESLKEAIILVDFNESFYQQVHGEEGSIDSDMESDGKSSQEELEESAPHHASEEIRAPESPKCSTTSGAVVGGTQPEEISADRIGGTDAAASKDAMDGLGGAASAAIDTIVTASNPMDSVDVQPQLDVSEALLAFDPPPRDDGLLQQNQANYGQVRVGEDAVPESMVARLLPNDRSETTRTITTSPNLADLSDDSPKGELASKLAARRLRTGACENSMANTASAGAAELAAKLAAQRDKLDTGSTQQLTPRSQRLADAAVASSEDGYGAAAGKSMKDKMAARRRQLDTDG